MSEGPRAVAEAYWRDESARDVDAVMKKWKTKAFAAAVDRDQIAQCEEKLGIPLSDFVALTLSAMQSHHEELGL